MIKFSIDNNSITRLKNISTLSSKFEKTSEGVILTFEENKITPHIYGNKSFLKYSIDVQNFQSTQQSIFNYIKIDFLKFIQAIEKCSINDDAVNVFVDIDKNNAIISPINSATPKITINCYDTIDEKQAETIVNTWDLNKNSDEFTSDTTDVLIGSDILDFATEASSIMSISNTTNAISINKNKLRYADRFCVIEKTADKDLIDSDKEIIITKSIFEFLKILNKSSGADVPTIFSKSGNFVRIDCAELGIKAVLWAGDIQYVYPNQEEYDAIKPTDDRKKSFTISKKDFIDALSKFDGIFSPTEYRWKQINFINNEEKKLYFEHQDYTAEVSTSVDINVLTDNLPTKDFAFQISGLVLKKIIDLIADDDLTIEYSDEAPIDIHGLGILIKSKDFAAVCTKLNSDA